MTLAAWQSGVCALMRQGVSGRTNCDVRALAEQLDLTGEERRSLLALENDRGLALTCNIVRWWRIFKTKGAAPLTMTQLAARADEYVADYISRSSFSTFFFMEEAAGFLDYLLTNRNLDRTTGAVVRFEKALLCANAAQETSRSGDEQEAFIDPPYMTSRDYYRTADTVTAVVFDRPVEVLLGALLAGRPAEPIVGRTVNPVVVSSDLEALWRPAARGEVRLIRILRKPMPLAEALAHPGVTLCDVHALLTDGLLVKVSERQEDGSDLRHAAISG